MFPPSLARFRPTLSPTIEWSHPKWGGIPSSVAVNNWKEVRIVPAIFEDRRGIVAYTTMYIYMFLSYACNVDKQCYVAYDMILEIHSIMIGCHLWMCSTLHTNDASR